MPNNLTTVEDISNGRQLSYQGGVRLSVDLANAIFGQQTETNHNAQLDRQVRVWPVILPNNNAFLLEDSEPDAPVGQYRVMNVYGESFNATVAEAVNMIKAYKVEQIRLAEENN